MKTGENGRQLIKSFEKLYLRPYDDHCPKANIEAPTYKVVGKLTAGYGHTGPDVTRNMIITQKMADDWLVGDLVEAEQIVNSYIKIPITQNQFDALVSFTFNTGGHTSKGKPATLFSLVNACASKEAITNSFMQWTKDNGQVMPGLVNRRKVEIDLFFS